MKKVFKIKKGNHYPTSICGLFKFVFGKPLSLEFQFDLDKSAEKYFLEGADQKDINKISGYSMGSLNHHKNSIRVGNCYNPSVDTVELYAYWYDGGVRNSRFICSYPRSMDIKWVYCKLITYPNEHTLKIVYGDWEFNHVIPRINDTNPYKWGKVLRPYFGGNKAAPHDMKIAIKR